MASLMRELWPEGCRAVAGLVFAQTCALCHSEAARTFVPALCDACAAALPRLQEPRCAVCGEWFVGNISASFRCSNCRDRRFAFDFATSGFQARRGARDLIHRFKYERQLWLGESLGRLLAGVLDGPHADPRLVGTDWVLVPVPLHPRREREREFNQARELAVVVGRLTGRPVADVLQRTRYTTVQASLARQDRLDNLRSAFRIRRRWWVGSLAEVSTAGRPVLLIDDVFTTGATMHECARVLRREGAAVAVVALTLARG